MDWLPYPWRHLRPGPWATWDSALCSGWQPCPQQTEVELHGLWGPFHPKPFYVSVTLWFCDSMILCFWLTSSITYQWKTFLPHRCLYHTVYYLCEWFLMVSCVQNSVHYNILSTFGLLEKAPQMRWIILHKGKAWSNVTTWKDPGKNNFRHLHTSKCFKKSTSVI